MFYFDVIILEMNECKTNIFSTLFSATAVKCITKKKTSVAVTTSYIIRIGSSVFPFKPCVFFHNVQSSLHRANECTCYWSSQNISRLEILRVDGKRITYMQIDRIVSKLLTKVSVKISLSLRPYYHLYVNFRTIYFIPVLFIPYSNEFTVYNWIILRILCVLITHIRCNMWYAFL